MATISTISSQRTLLEAFVATSAALGRLPLPAAALANEFDAWDDEPVTLRRSKKGRNDTTFRYYNAETFFHRVEGGAITARGDLLYRLGIVQQLALSSWLYEVGLTDDWCRLHIGLRIVKSLGYANATGFEYHHPDANLLAAILTPYGKWRAPSACKTHDD